ncbi:hypothetical protein V6Z12_A12G048300 [Gossypium hirsutum]
MRIPIREGHSLLKSLSLNDIFGCCSESTTIIVSSTTPASLKRTFLVFRSPTSQRSLAEPLSHIFSIRK